MNDTPTKQAPAASVSQAIKSAPQKPALIAYITAGFPDRESFVTLLTQVADSADVVEIGIPFSDPMADGVTIQRSSERALAGGVTLNWILDAIEANDFAAPLLLMGYLNPLLAFGVERLAERCNAASVAGFIVPDLPYEESELLTRSLAPADVGLVQMVTPATPEERIAKLAGESHGFVYAVTKTGTTGKGSGLPPELSDYLDRVRDVSPLPVCAGFGIRTRQDVERIAPHADGVVVGSALVEVIEKGDDPAAFLEGLRG